MLLKISVFTSLFSITAFAQTVTPQAGANPILFDQAAQTDNLICLMAGGSEHNSGMTVGNYGALKHMWITNFNVAGDYFKWNVSLAVGANYHVWALLNSGVAVPLRLSVSGQTATLDFSTRNIGWDKLDAGVINIPAGAHVLQLVRNTGTTSNMEIKSLELLRESDKPAHDTRVANFKRVPSWFSNARYGLMLQFGPWGYPPTGARKSLQNFANGFDVNRFVTLVQATGATYVVWSISWYEYKFIAPIRSLDSIIGASGYTTTRDLLGEIATALQNNGIRLFLYYHTGLGQEPAWVAKQNWPTNFYLTGTGDRSAFFNNWSAVVGEIGARYGTKLDGWFFDDGCYYYPAPFEQLGSVARTGNPNRLVSWNPWVAARFTDFQDVLFGEGYHGETQFGSSAQGGNGVFTDGPQKGLMGHGMFTLENDWGIHSANQTINTQVTLNQLQSWVTNARAYGRPLSLAMGMWEDQTYSQTTMNILVGLKNSTGIHYNTGHGYSPIPTGPEDYLFYNVKGARMLKKCKGSAFGVEIKTLDLGHSELNR